MTENKKFYGWILVAVLWVLYLINMGFPYYGASVINTYMAKALNMDRSTLGLGFTLITLLMGLSGPLVALSINKKGIRFTIFSGSLIIILGALLMGLVVQKNWQYFLVFGIIIGIGCALGSAIPVQTGVTLWFRRKRALAMSIALTATGIGGFIAAPLLNKVIAAANGNWRAGWFFVAGMSVLAALLAILLVRNKPSDLGQVPDGILENEGSKGVAIESLKLSRVYRTSEDWKVKEAVRTTTLWLIIAGFIIYSGIIGIFIAHGVIHLRDLGHAPATAAMSLGLLALCSIAGRLIAGALGDRIEPRYIWAVAMLFFVAGILAVIKATTVTQIYLYAIFLGIGYGAAYICWATMTSNYFGANSFASIMGLQAPIITIAGSIAPYLAGLVYDQEGSYSKAFMGTAILSVLALVLVLFARPPKLVSENVSKMVS